MNKQNKRTLLSSIIKDVIKESMDRSYLENNAIDEMNYQQSMMNEEDDDLFGGGDEKSKKVTPGLGEDEKEKLDKGNVSSDDIITKLNAIRAGRSFRDPKIAASVEGYVDSLKKPEKIALLAYLKGISQLVTGEIDAEDAMEPADDPAIIAMRKKNGQQQQKKVTIKPTIVKKPEKDKEEKKEKPPAEDTSGPVPIKPKK